MPLRYLLDTNICIYIAKARPAEVLTRFRNLQPGDVGMSVVTYGELRHGAYKSRFRAEAERILREFSEIIPVIEMGTEVGDRYGAIRTELEKSGQVIGNNDLWIAAHAIALGIPLVTNNEREFARVPGLALQNWVRRSAEIHERSGRYRRTR
jgi:tRNA(fMet)-specific endonuclease VapC